MFDLLCMLVSIFFYVHMGVDACKWSLENGIRSTGAGIIDSCELPGIGPVDWTVVLYKSTTCS